MLFLLFPRIAEASSTIETLMKSITDELIEPIVAVLFALAFLRLVWGFVLYLNSNMSSKSDGGSSLEKAKSHILWGVIGMFIMASVFGIMNMIVSSVGSI
jgi:cell division protein FtsW (lipid II flippase)